MSGDEFYAEGCSTLRHYSSALMHIRTVTVAQGLIVLAGAGLLNRESLLAASLCVALFGVALTGVLFFLHENYYQHFETILKCVIDVEKSRTSGSSCTGPWSAYDENRKEMIARFGAFGCWPWHRGPFALLFVAFGMVIVWTVLQWLFPELQAFGSSNGR